MSQIFLKILNMSLSASWLVLAVLFLRLVFKKAPKWVRVLLWGIVAIRLVCPVSVESVLSLIPSAEVVSPNIMMDPTPEIHTGIESFNSVINPVVTQAFAPQGLTSMNPLQLWIPLAAVIWLLGLAGMLIYTAVSYMLLRRKVGTAVLLRENIFQSEQVASPFVLGLVKPRIYLPFRLEGEVLGYVIAHEQAHISRKDHLWKPLGFLLLAIHWFNPLMWVGYILLCRDIELACDEKVIRELDCGEKADYTQALVSCSVSRRSIAACPLAFGEVGVKARVKSVLHYKKPAFWVIVVAVILCIVVAVCFLTNPVDSVRNPWVKEYVPGSEGMIGEVDKAKFENISVDFSIGADQYGRAVFKDPHKAFRTFTVLYAEAISSIQNSHNLAPISAKNYDLYKTYGWQTYASSEDKQQNMKFVTSFLDIYENSFTKEIPNKEQQAPVILPLDSATKWFDYYGERENVDRGVTFEIKIQDFPEVTFRAGLYEIVAISNDETTELYHGPIWSTYFCDITGDGYQDLCSTISAGSGTIMDGVIVYDFAQSKSYTLAEGRKFDYSLRLDERTGRLLVDKRRYKEETVLSSGELIFTGDAIQLSADVASTDGLQAAISQVILDKNAGDRFPNVPTGAIHTHSYRILDVEGVSGTPMLSADEHSEEVTAYIHYLYARYYYSGGQLESAGETCTPAAITFKVEADGSYTLKEFWEPDPGEGSDEAIQEKFPPAAAQVYLDRFQPAFFSNVLRAECYAQANDYLEQITGNEREYKPYIDKIDYDIDGDGAEETVTLTYGPTSGLFSITLYATSAAKSVEYVDTFVLGPYYDFSFAVEEGTLRLKGVSDQSTPPNTSIDVGLKDGHITLWCEDEDVIWGTWGS